MSGTNDAFGGFRVEDAIEILERRRWWIAVGAVFGLALGLFLGTLLLPVAIRPLCGTLSGHADRKNQGNDGGDMFHVLSLPEE